MVKTKALLSKILAWLAGQIAIKSLKLRTRGIDAADSTGYYYPLIHDNGTNLWIGSPQTAAQHHRGETYISSGYDGSAGNETVKVSVPNASNTGASNYRLIHEGLTDNDGITINGVKYMTIGATQATKSGSAWTSGNLTLYRRGNIVHLTGAPTISALSARTTVATIPNVNLRPVATVYGHVNGSTDYMLVNKEGLIQFNAGSAGTKYFSIDYMAAT